MKILYTAEATATGARQGKATSSDGILDLDLQTPKEMGGPGGATNPEQLFAAGYAACFQGAMGVVARQEKLSIAGSTVTARVGLGTESEHKYNVAVELDVKLPELDRKQAEELVEKAHQVCPYSNATRGNVDVKLSIVE